MKRFWQMVIRFRVVFAAVSIAALLATLWLRNLPPPAPVPGSATAMPVETAVKVESSITEVSPVHEETIATLGVPEKGVPADEYLAAPAIQTSSQQSSGIVSGELHAPIKGEIATPTTQMSPATSFATSNPAESPQQGLLNGAPKEQ